MRINLSDAGAPEELEPEARAPSSPVSRPSSQDGWFTQEEIQEYQNADDAEILSKLVGGTHPGASREETLFRYHVSKAVYLRRFDLPPLPTATAQILRLGRRVDANIGEYVTALQPDPSMVSSVMRVSNSALFSGNQEYKTLEQAITRIGLAEVEKTVLLHAFNSKVFRVSGHGRTISRLVDHGVVTSFATQAFGRLFDVPGTTAFVAGLFHDVGKFIVLQMLASVQRQRRWIAPSKIVESAFEAFHVQIGIQLCQSWEAPDEITEAVASHHDPERACVHALNRSVYLANRLAHAMEQGATTQTSQNTAITDVIDSWFARDPVAELGLVSPDKVRSVLEDVERELATFRSEADRARA